MDFARMKRRELQELCSRHGLAARGSKADLAAGLAGALSRNAAAAAAANFVGVVAGKGCLKRSGSGSSRAAKTVTFALEGKSEAGEAPPAAAVSGRVHLQKFVEIGGDSTDEGDAEEVGSDDAGTRSRANVKSSCAEAKEEGKVVVVAVDTKQKTQDQDNAKDIAANVQAVVSNRSARKSSVGADSGVQSCDNPPEVDDKEEVIGEAVCMKRKTRGSCKTDETLPVAAVSRRGRRRKHTEEHGSDLSAEGVTQLVADAQVKQSNRNPMHLCAGEEVESQNIPSEAVEKREVVQENVELKLKIRKDAEDIVANIHSEISCRSMRSSSLSVDVVLLCPIVEKKIGRRAKDCNDELDVDVKAAEVQDLTSAASNVIVESKKSQSKGHNCEPATQKTVKVDVLGRVTRSCSVKAAVMLPIVAENKRRKTKDVHQDREPPVGLELEVPRNDVPVTRLLRNRVVQISHAMPEGTRADKNLEKKRQPRNPAIHRHQQFAASVEDKKLVVPCKSPQVHENIRGEFQNAKGEDVGKQAALGEPR
ncbi:hypothetical protein ACP4OV_003167 [Aristida adscensionis]